MSALLDAAYGRARARYGEQFDDVELRNADSVARAIYGTGTRVIVETRYPDGSGHVRAGSIGLTTGWRPTFLIMHRSSDDGSWDTLGPRESVDGRTERIVAMRHSDGRYYARDGVQSFNGPRVRAPRGQEWPESLPAVTGWGPAL